MKKSFLVSLVAGLVYVGSFFGASSGFARDQGVAQNPLASVLQGKGCRVLNETTVSHAKAESDLGAYACLGYLHARDRAWQMDFLRRIVQGRRAEVLGYKSLVDDLQMRLLRLDKKAERVFAKMSEEERAPLWAYAYGVNQGFQTDRATHAYEFEHYGYQPEEWKPADSIGILLLQAFDQTKQTFTRKLDEQKWADRYGKDAQALFSRRELPWTTTILKEGEYQASSSRADMDQELNALPIPSEAAFFPTADVGLGSNNWAVAPDRSSTQKAFFANDPHLDMKHPPFWYWVHLEGAKIDAIGASLPGTPMIASGSNRHVAWGLTNAYFDVSELAYVPNEDLQGHTKTFWPVVWIKYGSFKIPFFFKSFQRTEQGWPILPVEGPNGYSLVLRWSGYEIKPSDLAGMFEILRVQNAKEMDIALSHVGLPSWNFTYADTQGVIGYRTVGLLPKRETELPFGVPVRRFSEWARWTYLTADEAPHVVQPQRGYVVTANNQQWPSNSVFRDGREQASSFRAYRIEELLKKTPKHDRESLRRIQCDVQAVDARFLVPVLLKSLDLAASHDGGLTPHEQRVVDGFKSWDLEADENCLPCGVYNRWLDRLLADQTLDRESLYRALTAPKPSGELLGSLLASFRLALDDVGVTADGQMKKWGEIHVNPFSHFSGDSYFSVPPISTPGVEHSVAPGTAEWDPSAKKYVQTTGASQRMIVEMTNPPTVHVVVAGSEQDIEKPDLADPQGPWMKWKRCEIEQKRFPLDWSQITSEQVSFH